jgi:hypothetical protein
MSSKEYETKVTISICGDEQDVTVRAHVEYAPGFGGAWGGTLDGDIEALVGGAWVPLDELELDEGDMERATEALEEACSHDDSDCAEREDYEAA